MRHRLLGFAVLACATLACAQISANAQGAAHPQGAASYPNRTVRIIVPLPAGGVADAMGRLVAEHLAATWGQPVVVENRSGAGSAIGMDVVAKAAPDGYTIGLGNIAANAVNPALQRDKVPYEPIKDFVPISLVGIAPSMLVVNAQKIPAKTLAEFIAYLKSKPGEVTFGSSGVGSSLHIGMELFMLRSETKMVHVPYRGSAPMIADLLSGQIDAALDSASTAMQHVKAGKFRALGVTTRERAFFAPEIPPIADTMPGFEVKSWHGMMAPAGTPPQIVQKLQEAIQAYLRTPAAAEKLKQQGVIPVGNSSAEFLTLMQDEYALYQKVIKDAGVKPE